MNDIVDLLAPYGPYGFGVVAVYFIWKLMVVPDKKMNLEQAKIHLTTAQTMREVTQELSHSIRDLQVLHRVGIMKITRDDTDLSKPS